MAEPRNLPLFLFLRRSLALFSAPNPPADPNATGSDFDLWIEDYLDHLCAPLVGTLAYPLRLELRRETKEHLLALAQAYEELGYPSDEALRAAMRQFGDPRTLGAEYARQYDPPLPQFSMAYGIGVFALAFLLAGGLMVVNDFWEAGFFRFATFLAMFPLFAGYQVGLKVPRHPVRVAAFASSLLWLAVWGVFTLIETPDQSQLGSLWSGLGLACYFLPALPNGCVGAFLGRWIRRRRERAKGWGYNRMINS